MKFLTRIAILLLTLLAGGGLVLAQGQAEGQGGGAPAARTTVITFGAIVDGTGERLQATEIAVADGRIVAVGDGLAARYPAAAQIDNSGLTAIPGLIDAHVHITYALAGAPEGDAWAELAAMQPEALLDAAARNARLALEAGVTTVRDLHSGAGVGYALREQIEAGVIEGPRLYLSGGGIHPSTLPEAGEGGERDLPTLFADIAAERAGEGADWVKIFATSGSADDLTAAQHFHYPEIRSAVEAAHGAGLRVAVHSYGPAAVPGALRAGVDSIEHPVDLTDEILAEWAGTDTIYVPTVDHNRYYADHAAEYGYGPEVVADLRAFVEKNTRAVARAHAAGITIAMGSDALMTMFGQNTRELLHFVDAGMSPAEALRTATVNGAMLLGEGDSLGRLRPGYAADIVGVRGDPLADIRAVVDGVAWVMKDGRVVVDRR